MPVTYDVDSNYLTNPPSHYPRVKPIDTLDIDALARQINIHNPNMPVNSVLAVLNLFIEEVQFQLTEGNWVKLENFCSFTTSITEAVLANPSDPLPAGYKIEVKAKPAAPFKQSIRDAASVSRDGIISKTPEISSAIHGLYGFQNIAEEGYGLDINGKNIGFDITDTDQGVFITPDGGSETKQSNITRIKPSNVIIVPDVTLTSASQTACLLTIKSKYTENGQVKEGSYLKKVRFPNAVSSLSSNHDALVPYGGSATVDLTFSDAGNFLIRARISNLNQIFVTFKSMTAGVWSDWYSETEVTAAGMFDVVGGVITIAFTVADYDAFFDMLNADGRYATELFIVS